MSDKTRKLKDIDSFWDLNALLPKKRPVNPAYQRLDTSATEVSVEGNANKEAGVQIPPRDKGRRLNELPMRKRAEEYRSKPLDPYLIYKPDNRLIKLVEVSAWNNRFNFYEKFLSDAARLWNKKGEAAEHTPFFSYVPQYSQLGFSQLKWYLWWRENVRQGVYLKADFCYVLLYIYEIINCPEKLPPENGVEILAKIWLHYRPDYRRLDNYMCEWLCDYCLIHKLPCPTKTLRPILSNVTELAALKEFYMDFSNPTGLKDTILHAASSYDFAKSRYYTEEYRGIFQKHIEGAAEAVAAELMTNPKYKDLFGANLRVTRTSYESALCAYSAKRSITVEYTSYARSPKFRFMATDIVKYSENKIRAALGIRPRLKVTELSDGLTELIDAYFAKELPSPEKREKKPNTEPDKMPYDKLYEPTFSTLSVDRALEIEKSSWSTTELLTDTLAEDCAESDEVNETVPKTSASAPPECDDVFGQLIGSLDKYLRTALLAVLAKDGKGLSSAGETAGKLPEALVDAINEAAYDIVGDIIIESANGEYQLIPDYEGEILKWLN